MKATKWVYLQRLKIQREVLYLALRVLNGLIHTIEKERGIIK